MKLIPPEIVEVLQDMETTTTLKEEHHFLKGHVENLSLYSLEVNVNETKQRNTIAPEAYQKLLNQITKVYNRIEEIEQLPFFKVITPIKTRLSAIETHKGS